MDVRDRLLLLLAFAGIAVLFVVFVIVVKPSPWGGRHLGLGPTWACDQFKGGWFCSESVPQMKPKDEPAEPDPKAP